MVEGTERRSMQTPASRLVAEALVEGHEPSQIVNRAEALGLPASLTNAVVAACCGTQVGQSSPQMAKHIRDTAESD